MGLDNDIISKLGSRLAEDTVIAGLPAPDRARILMEVAGTRFGVVWDVDHGFDIRPTPDINDAWDFSFSVPTPAWQEFAKVSPPPLNNTAQALVAQFGDTLIAGDRVKWAQYAPVVERILAGLKPTRARSEAPSLPRKSAITASYITIDYDGREYRLFYEEAGQGIPMICLHTAGSDSRQYKYLLEDPQLQADYRMIAFDLPWHGRSMPPRGWRGERYENSIEWYLQIIRGFTAAMQLPEKPVLVGCSMGGSVSLVMSALYGAEWRAVCALEGTLGGNHLAPSRRGVWTRHLEVDHSMFLSTWVAGLMSPDSPQDLQDEVLWEYGQSGPGVYNGDGAMITSLQQTGPTLTESKCPLYVFSGEYDYSATPALSEAAARQLGGEFILMTGKGHFPMAEDPAGFKQYFTPVLEKIKRAQ